jgi:hypothetical protein
MPILSENFQIVRLVLSYSVDKKRKERKHWGYYWVAFEDKLHKIGDLPFFFWSVNAEKGKLRMHLVAFAEECTWWPLSSNLKIYFENVVQVLESHTSGGVDPN